MPSETHAQSRTHQVKTRKDKSLIRNIILLLSCNCIYLMVGYLTYMCKCDLIMAYVTFTAIKLNWQSREAKKATLTHNNILNTFILRLFLFCKKSKLSSAKYLCTLFFFRLLRFSCCNAQPFFSKSNSARHGLEETTVEPQLSGWIVDSQTFGGVSCAHCRHRQKR